MKLIVGLGNPGPKYAANRHNVGFMALDRIAADHGFPVWRNRFQGETTEGRLGEQRVLLLKPATFMNLSGQSVGEAMRYLKLTPADVLVLHDELDLPPGKLRLKTGGGHAGHNGLRSLHQHIGDSYRRLRIGVGHPGDKNRVADYVLSDFPKAEARMLDDLLRAISDGAEHLAAGDDGRFMNAVHGGKKAAGHQPTAEPMPARPGSASGIVSTPQPDPAPATFADKLRALGQKFR